MPLSDRLAQAHDANIFPLVAMFLAKNAGQIVAACQHAEHEFAPPKVISVLRAAVAAGSLEDSIADRCVTAAFPSSLKIARFSSRCCLQCNRFRWRRGDPTP